MTQKPPPQKKKTETRAQSAARAQLDQIITHATVGASLAEIAAYHEVSEDWLAKNFSRQLAKAWARRNIHIRSALTKAALNGNIQALNRVTDLEKKANDATSNEY